MLCECINRKPRQNLMHCINDLTAPLAHMPFIDLHFSTMTVAWTPSTPSLNTLNLSTNYRSLPHFLSLATFSLSESFLFAQSGPQLRPYPLSVTIGIPSSLHHPHKYNEQTYRRGLVCSRISNEEQTTRRCDRYFAGRNALNVYEVRGHSNNGIKEK